MTTSVSMSAAALNRNISIIEDDGVVASSPLIVSSPAPPILSAPVPPVIVSAWLLPVMVKASLWPLSVIVTPAAAPAAEIASTPGWSRCSRQAC